MDEVLKHCSSRGEFLVHLYWPERMNYFRTCSETFDGGGAWLLVATPHHGVHEPDRPTINFLVADREFAKHYQTAAEARGFHHGLMVRRSAMENVIRRRGYELAAVAVGHPSGYGVTDPGEYWRYDIGNHRFAVLESLRFATVVRLATPQAPGARSVELDAESVVAWW
ncbi:hypothetical protein [Sorangium sp. So ce1151]|uniref:hypothetical protein n=1 Tax=Sorangium sp. So ce1151 TaxID=3133332 RepID=UPI003F5E469A